MPLYLHHWVTVLSAVMPADDEYMSMRSVLNDINQYGAIIRIASTPMVKTALTPQPLSTQQMMAIP